MTIVVSWMCCKSKRAKLVFINNCKKNSTQLEVVPDFPLKSLLGVTRFYNFWVRNLEVEDVTTLLHQKNIDKKKENKKYLQATGIKIKKI